MLQIIRLYSVSELQLWNLSYFVQLTTDGGRHGICSGLGGFGSFCVVEPQPLLAAADVHRLDIMKAFLRLPLGEFKSRKIRLGSLSSGKPLRVIQVNVIIWYSSQHGIADRAMSMG